MWWRFTAGLIGVLGLLLVIMVSTRSISVRVDVPAGTLAPHPVWMAAWIFILVSAAIIVAVSIVRFGVWLFRSRIFD
jgi:hypothetical protein